MRLYFQFENKDTFYLQTHGTAMGTRMAPQYANAFMADLEGTFLRNYPKKPTTYERFIDDGRVVVRDRVVQSIDAFMVWIHGEEELLKFKMPFANKIHRFNSLWNMASRLTSWILR